MVCTFPLKRFQTFCMYFPLLLYSRGRLCRPARRTRVCDRPRVAGAAAPFPVSLRMAWSHPSQCASAVAFLSSALTCCQEALLSPTSAPFSDPDFSSFWCHLHKSQTFSSLLLPASSYPRLASLIFFSLLHQRNKNKNKNPSFNPASIYSLLSMRPRGF